MLSVLLIIYGKFVLKDAALESKGRVLTMYTIQCSPPLFYKLYKGLLMLQ